TPARLRPLPRDLRPHRRRLADRLAAPHAPPPGVRARRLRRRQRAAVRRTSVAMVRPMHDAVTVHMKASPQSVWELVSDVTKIGSYSPETFEAEWLDGATGPSVGARFRGHVKRNGKGPVYWTSCSVTECEPNRGFTFGGG